MIIGHACTKLSSLELRATIGVSRAMTPLDDGTYDALIIDATRREDGDALELTITTGAHRGDVISIVTSTFAARDPLTLLGLPCTLHVRGDVVRVAL
jgi:hypothetical protein